MKLAISAAAVAFGYALIYYGIQMFRGYDATDTNSTGGAPLSVLLGVKGDGKTYAHPPFQYKVVS